MKKSIVLIIILSISTLTLAQESNGVLFKNVRIFDAPSATLSDPSDVYVSQGKITAIGSLLLRMYQITP